MLKYKYFNIFILPALLVLFISLYFGVFFEDNDDLVMSLLLKGSLQPYGGYYEISYWAYLYLWYIYLFLYNNFPSLPWLGLSLFIFNYAAAVNISFILEHYLPRNINLYLRSAFLFLILSVLLIENIVLIDFTRTSILLAGTSILAAFILFKENMHKIGIAISSLLFITGFLIRPMGAFLISFIILPYVIFIGYRSGMKKFSLSFAGSVFFLSLLIYISFQYFRPALEKESIKHYNAIARIIDYDYEKTGQLFNKQDSLKEKAIKYFFITDKQQVSNEYVEKISSNDNIFKDKSTIPRLKASFKYTSIFLYKDYIDMSLIYLLLFAVIYYLIFKKNKKGFIYFIILQIIFFSVLIVINTIMKLPERLFVPLYGMFIISNICFPEFSEVKSTPKKMILCVSVILILSFGISLAHINTKQNIIENRSTENYQTFLTLEKTFSNTMFILTKPATIIADGFYPMKEFPLGSNKIFPLIGWTTTIPSYYKELSAICGSVNINDFVNYLKNRPGFLFISDDEFNNFLSDYFHTLYNNEIGFVRYESTPEILKRRDLYLYKIIQK